MTLRSVMTAYIIGGKDYRISGTIRLAEQYMPIRNHIVTLIRKIPPHLAVGYGSMGKQANDILHYGFQGFLASQRFPMRSLSQTI